MVAQGDERPDCHSRQVPWLPCLAIPLRLRDELHRTLDGGDERWVPRAVAALGVYSLAAMAWIRRRPLVTGSPEALAGSYRARFFIGVGLAQSAALFGLAGVFIGGSLWIYLVGLAFGLVGFWMIAPTRLDIERRQREITAAGSPISLLDALTADPTP
jgi:hypothetical protein